ncbi:MAG: ribosome biogenesis GTPase Der [Flavobacteriales bacterium]|jgi:GTP-binding protein|tara:strand:+ start:3216 stop:4520 length:1305 start_codon:yes stop_codon:yes gene_type:complete
MANIVAIVGRPNVGKSTFFNRMVQRRQAIVDSVSGVTRDRHYGKTDWNGQEFSIIDTGGYIIGSDDIFEEEIRKQVDLAIDEANVILFLVDAQIGVTDLDITVANHLRKAKKPLILVANKVDNAAIMQQAVDLYSLGLGEYFCISAVNGSGTGELLDAVVESLPPEPIRDETDLPRFAIVGRPNVGKSSFINALVGEDRNIVTNIAGTTRDSLDTHYTKFGHDFTLVDTAGVRKKKNVHEDLEFYSVMRSIRSIEYSDVCLLIIDATLGFESQDQSIFHLADKNRKGIVILVNKWDLVEKDTHSVKEYEEMIRNKISPFTDVPIVFVSALNKQRLLKALQVAIDVFKDRKARITTSKLNAVMLPIIEITPPPATKGKYVKIKFCTQLPTKTPTFAFFANLPQYVKDPYKRFIENKLRENFDFSGVPIQIFFRKK